MGLVPLFDAASAVILMAEADSVAVTDWAWGVVLALSDSLPPQPNNIDAAIATAVHFNDGFAFDFMASPS
jgi:hypothetical protein